MAKHLAHQENWNNEWKQYGKAFTNKNQMRKTYKGIQYYLLCYLE